MLLPRLTNCPECANIPNLLQEIDCKLAEYANGLYNNITFMLNQSVPAGIMIQLIAYRRILTYKNSNPDYIYEVSINRIASKVKLLTLGLNVKSIYTSTPGECTTSTSTSTTTTVYPYCNNFTPTSSYTIVDSIFNPTSSYFYGNFTGYIENDVPVNFKNLIKLNSDLTVDAFFNTGIGFNEVLYAGSSILQQPDGKIIVTGTFTTYQGIPKNRIVRLNTDASIDTSFVIGGGFSSFTQSPGIDSNGSIIVPGIFGSYNGTSSPRIARLLTDGTIDPSFIVGSGFNNTTLGVIINSDNSMFIVGYFNSYKGVAVSPGITKLLANGSVDSSFVGGTGIFPYAPNNANFITRIEGETSFYISGFINTYKGVAVKLIVKIQMNGDIDPSFNTGTGFDGTRIYTTNIIWGDKLLIRGNFENYNGNSSYNGIILNSDGSIYFTFDAIYNYPVVIGNILYAAPYSGCLEYLHTFVPTIS